MSYKLGRTSKRHYKTLEPNLQLLVDDILKFYDISVVCGHRNEEDQDKAFAEGKSELQWPESEHNKFPSNAMDIAPYKNGINWKNKKEFYFMAGIITALAYKRGIKIFWGARWTDLEDCPHFHLVD